MKKSGVIISLIAVVVLAVASVLMFPQIKDGLGALWGEISGKQRQNDEPSEPKGPREAEDVKFAKEMLGTMSLEEKVGQMLFSRVPEGDAIGEIEKYHLGGYILFGRDVTGESLESIRGKVDAWQAASKVPMLIGIDEEGGTVSRLSYAGLADFLSPQELYSEGGMDRVRQDTAEKAQILAKIGVNVNFAPVADTCEDPEAFIFSRSFGKGAKETAEYVRESVKAYQGSGVAPTLKHFPGYGENVDTHTGIAVDERSLESFRANDFLPFVSGIEAGAEFIMVSHNIMTSVDAERPASISPEVHKILREELGFSGIILTDDLEMDAISQYYQGEYAPEVMAVLAGNTMLVISDYQRGYENILQAVKNGVITEEKIDEAVMKILAYKHKHLDFSQEV